MFMQECRLTSAVNGRREVGGEVGYYPSCSLPMRMGRAGAVKTDCFAGPCYFNRDLQWNVFYPLRRPASLTLEPPSCSLLRGA